MRKRSSESSTLDSWCCGHANSPTSASAADLGTEEPPMAWDDDYRSHELWSSVTETLESLSG